MKKKIKDLLRSNKKYRKSDRVLMARIWYEDLGYKIHENPKTPKPHKYENSFKNIVIYLY